MPSDYFGAVAAATFFYSIVYIVFCVAKCMGWDEELPGDEDDHGEDGEDFHFDAATLQRE